VGCLGEATEVDHVIDVVLGGKVLDESNLRAVCTRCHRRRSNAMRQRTRRSPPSREWPTPKVLEEP
jgi:5-methylcytosine-specific restriction endonuclease McrA